MRILVVEDDEQYAAIIARGLRQHAFAVDVAADGEQPSFFTETNEYDVVVLDAMLPKVDGLEVCRRLRERLSHVAILMLTASRIASPGSRRAQTTASSNRSTSRSYSPARARFSGAIMSIADRFRQSAISASIRPRRRPSEARRPLGLTTKEYALLESLA